jgi:hypothetical protein
MKRSVFILLIIAAGVVCFNSCKKKITGCTSQTALNYNFDASEDDGSCIDVGASYEGGLLLYVLQPGDTGYDASVKHGLIASPTDLSSGIRWDNDTATQTGVYAYELGMGRINTESIVLIQGDGDYAAKLCSDFELNGYDDWFLPSYDELTILYKNRNAVGCSNTSAYWSSSEFTMNYRTAWELNFKDGTHIFRDKAELRSVRALRYF